MKHRIDENRKVTLSLGQLKKLVMEEHNSESEYLDEIDQDFTDEVAKLTDANYHAEAYEAVARKCAEILPKGNDLKDFFNEYAAVLSTIGKWQEFHKISSSTLIFAVEQALFKDIKFHFGKEFSDKIGQGL